MNSQVQMSRLVRHMDLRISWWKSLFVHGECVILCERLTAPLLDRDGHIFLSPSDPAPVPTTMAIKVQSRLSNCCWVICGRDLINDRVILRSDTRLVPFTRSRYILLFFFGLINWESVVASRTGLMVVVVGRPPCVLSSSHSG